MEIKTNIDKKQGLRIHTVSGSVSKDELLSKLIEIYSRPDFQSKMNVLWDLRSADLESVVMSDIVKTRDLINDNQKNMMNLAFFESKA